jgi:hypothetical protein
VRSLRRSPAKHIDLLPQDQVFRFQRCSRLEARRQDTENQLEQIGHQDASLRRPLAASTPNRIFGTHRSVEPTIVEAAIQCPPENRHRLVLKSSNAQQSQQTQGLVARALSLHASNEVFRKRTTGLPAGASVSRGSPTTAFSYRNLILSSLKWLCRSLRARRKTIVPMRSSGSSGITARNLASRLTRATTAVALQLLPCPRIHRSKDCHATHSTGNYSSNTSRPSLYSCLDCKNSRKLVEDVFNAPRLSSARAHLHPLPQYDTRR